jgi:chromosome segregation ATPase
MAEPTVQELQRQLEDLNKKLKEAGGLGINLQEAFRNAGNDTKKLNEYVNQLNKQYEELTDNVDYVYRTFQDITGELKNQNINFDNLNFKYLVNPIIFK